MLVYFRRTLLIACAAILAMEVLSPAAAAAPSGNRGREYYEQRGDVIWEVPNKEKVIALTFDDGPDPQETTHILDLLKQYDAKATFFVVGKQVEKYPEVARREVAEGHELGNHTYDHAYFNRGSSAETIANQLRRTQEAIFKATGKRSYLFRPPGGFYSDRMIETSKKEGYLVVMWSWHQDTRDWNRPGVGKIVKKVLGNARNGDIVLMHDHVEGKSQTIDALKKILPELKKRGFRFVTVSELTRYNIP
ncbi:polysaccharide deacetylase family protein [Paenibacillus azoreducens]|uniref:polysaccharide deacetylase family protein n=1 Tax=Paenibacillus azoreducens TaxID=116718 RepID=UPI0039F5494B